MKRKRCWARARRPVRSLSKALGTEARPPPTPTPPRLPLYPRRQKGRRLPGTATGRMLIGMGLLSGATDVPPDQAVVALASLCEQQGTVPREGWMLRTLTPPR